MSDAAPVLPVSNYELVLPSWSSDMYPDPMPRDNVSSIVSAYDTDRGFLQMQDSDDVLMTPPLFSSNDTVESSPLLELSQDEITSSLGVFDSSQGESFVDWSDLEPFLDS